MIEIKKSLAQRREKHAAKIARLIRVHCWKNSLLEPVDASPTKAQINKIAKKLGVTPRTIYRDLAHLDLIYELLGDHMFDDWR